MYDVPKEYRAAIRSPTRNDRMAGKLILTDPVAVDLYCAGGSCPETIQAKAILCNQQTPKWLSKAGDTPVYYDAETPTAVVRPGKSVVYEEVQPLAVQ